MASDSQPELFEPEQSEPIPERCMFVVPIHLPVTIPRDGVWKVETQASGNRMVRLIEEGDADG